MPDKPIKKSIVFNPPGKDAPGYFRRQRKVLELYSAMQKDPQPQVVDAFMEYLTQFVSEPEDHDARLDALFDASENQITSLIISITGTRGAKDEDAETENPT